MNKEIYLLLIVTCFTMCTQRPQSDGSIPVDLDKPQKASLFDYFSSIELIPLETYDDVLISGITKMKEYQNKYYALDPLQCIIFVFDDTGKFLHKIDKKGQGEGEYTFISDFVIEPSTGNIEILEPYGKLFTYDSVGNYIETKRVNFPELRAIHTLSPIDSSTYVFTSSFQPKKVIYYNIEEEDKLLHQEFEEASRLGSFANHPYKYNGEWFFFRPIHPIVYKMGKERLEPAFEFDFGKHYREGTTANFSESSSKSLSKALEELFAQFPYLIYAVRHNNRYVFASLSINDSDNRSNMIHDKTTGKSKFITKFDEGVLFNSYRGEEIIVTDEYVLMPIQWLDLEKRVTKEMLDDEQQKIFETLINSEMEENPVLIKYWFK